MNELRATVRVQLHAGFTLDDAAAQVPYFSRLGISHVYASPILMARPGSSHGYDTLDYGRVNPELGGRDALCRLVMRLREYAMGLIVDIVPNHMAVGGTGNRWWEDLLAWGRASQYAHYFDVDWDAFAPWLHGRILAPFLDRPYGTALRDGVLRLVYEAETGMFFIHHHDHRFPVCPRHYAALLDSAGAPHALCDALRELAPLRGACMTDAPALSRLAQWGKTPDGRAAIARVMEQHDTGTACGRSGLHDLLVRQAYRLAWWRTTPDLINWRRFFDITGLAALSVEHDDVFDAVHGHIVALYADGLIDGVRVDHVDGLTQPRSYCRRLRQRLMAVQHLRPAMAPQSLSIHVEKILHDREHLPASWQVDGTTGYDFMDQVSAVLHDPAGTAPLDGLWRDHAIEDPTFATTQRNARVQVLNDVFAAELSRLRTHLGHIAQCNVDTRDYSMGRIGMVLQALLVEFHSYRTYFSDDGSGGHQADHIVLRGAAREARRHLLPSCHEMLDWIVDTLGQAGPRDGSIRVAQQQFEHLTAPLAAKAVEDTSFYRYGRLLSRNEVGSDPGRISLSCAQFHKDNLHRYKAYPATLLATATHDHKRGEDARMRLAVLSEVAPHWRDLVNRWIIGNAHLRQRRMIPDRADEMILYQSMLGAWPLEPWPDAEARQVFHDRIVAWQIKALREAKRHTNWIDPDAEYERGCREFVGRLLDPHVSGAFIAEMDAIVARIAPAAAVNSITQVVLRLTLPGVPDLYQGTELWDFSLVDPDNRRPVDFTLRQTLMQHDTSLRRQAAQWRTGGVKMHLIQRLLAFRARYPLMFSKGTYEPVEVSGPAEQHVIAFLRREGGNVLLVVVVRCVWGLVPSPHDLSLDAPTLGQTYLSLPVSGNGEWCSILHENRTYPQDARLSLSFLQEGIPVECLVQAQDGFS